MDRFKAMQTFVQIAEQGSLTRAAEVLGTSLPAVVRSLAALEAHLGVRLFHRTTRRLSLTEEGRHYLPSARDVLLAADTADLALKTEAHELAGQLTITAPVLFGHMYVAPAITRFMQRHEKVRCSVRLYDRTVNLLEEGIDVGIRIGALEDSSLVAQTLGTIRRVVVASPAYLAQRGTPQHPSDLAGAPCVRGRIDAPPQWTFHQGGKTFRVTPSSRLEFNHLAPAIEACAAGMGFGTFFSYQVLQMVAQGRLKLVLEDYEPPPKPVNVIYPNARLLPARTRAFIDWMKAEFCGLRL
ncbi:LysR family transcriptional regulator [Variovorax sp. EL159]|uniref:LysR family transcriptional regulator n=1 Tax=Variovorax sp. EL159 TaxID=1566270 RepID=UPI0008901182|nr:LysR family transcriptional regulator [Variovorax sp. EL159]SCX72162.1 DNA-binding transcriptional regulator, LysR family [Variovorax sp. EL159]